MKCFVPEISWHNRDPVYSVDFQPKRGKNESFYRLASGGADFHVVIWHVTLTPTDTEEHFASFECAADLQRHQKCVNVVRFSPNGVYLGSGDDDGYIVVWKMREDIDPPELPGGDSDKDKESWIAWKVLRGHLQDVYDLAWSPDSAFLVSGSIDNTALLWDVEKRKNLGFLGDHKGFVQGVAWDPKGKYIATLSTDRNLRIFDSAKKRQIAKCFKGKLPPALLKGKENKVTDEEKGKEKLTKLFHNETVKTFFRRLTFTPHGDLLITPCGVIEDENKNHDVSYVFTRGSFTKPALHLPSPGLYTVAARSCPILFQLRGTAPSLFALPYRAVYTIATRNALILYDTEQKGPFGYVGNIHYTGITDITWSPDGRLLIASSSEGFCSVITFDEGEIGEEYAPNDVVVEEQPPVTTAIEFVDNSKSLESHKAECENMDTEESISVKPTEATVETDEVNLKVEDKMEVEISMSDKKSCTPEKEKDSCQFRTPTKIVKRNSQSFLTPERPVSNLQVSSSGRNDSAEDLSLNDCSQNSVASDLSICIVGDEGDLISKEEQARRLMSPYRASPTVNSPSTRTPKMSPKGSPSTPRSGRRVNFTTLSSPKSKRKL